MDKEERRLRRKASDLMDLGKYNEAREILFSLEKGADSSKKSFDHIKARITVNVTNRFNELLKQSGDTLREVAKQTGVSENTLGNIKRGTSPNTSYAIVVSIAEYFGVSTDEFRQ